MSRVPLAILTAATALALCVGFADAAVSPAIGTYQGTVNGTPTTKGHNEGEGYFTLKVINGGKKIVRTCGSIVCFPKILAPSSFKCNQLNASIQAARIAVSGGAFDYQGSTPIGPGGTKRNIRFKGHWVAPKKVVGFTQISGGGCSHKDFWTMRSPPPA